MKTSPKFIIKLIHHLEKYIWDEFETYKNVEGYIKRWYQDDGPYGNWSNFTIIRKEDGNIDLRETLFGINDDELLFQIAIDMGIEIPGLIYSIPVIKGILSIDYKTASMTFENALKKVYSEPSTSVTCANSALESIIKHICEDSSIADCDNKDTLYKLTSHILKQFHYYPTSELDNNIKQIGSGLLKVAQNIEAIRSNHADTSHGKTSDDVIIDDTIYAMFVVNTVTTVGLFLLNYYEKKYKAQNPSTSENDLPF